MTRSKLLLLVFILFAMTSCSIVNKIKEKISSDKKTESTSEQKEETVAVTSQSDVNFYNQYIETLNKVRQSGEKLNNDYQSDIPEPESVSKNSFILAVGMSFAVNELERLIKELKRSLYDGGELSKLEADNREMQREVEAKFKNLLNVMESYHKTGNKVHKYYSEQEFKNDPGKATNYDVEMQKAYEEYKSSFKEFENVLKSYKPKRNKIDVESISEPGERSRVILLNAYENTLEKAELFYEDFQNVKIGDDLSDVQMKIADLKQTIEQENETVKNAEFTDATKYLKYSWEDYFYKQVNTFIEQANKFTKNPGSKKWEFNNNYNNVVIYYNNLVTAYNTSINVLNSVNVIPSGY